jgi:hypothetical protein
MNIDPIMAGYLFSIIGGALFVQPVQCCLRRKIRVPIGYDVEPFSFLEFPEICFPQTAPVKPYLNVGYP